MHSKNLNSSLINRVYGLKGLIEFEVNNRFSDLTCNLSSFTDRPHDLLARKPQTLHMALQLS